MQHNCGGEDAHGARKLKDGEWEALLAVMDRASFDALPFEIAPTAEPDGRITVVTDDTRECVTWSDVTGDREVCAWSFALQQSTTGGRARQVMEAVKKIASLPRTR